jgi:5-methylcytosine-specific restriction endonuclease McrBC regulatory subunit McrC
MKNVYERLQDDYGLSAIEENHLRYTMDVPKWMTTKTWLEYVQKITSPNEFLEYLENVIERIKVDEEYDRRTDKQLYMCRYPTDN